MEFSSEEWSKVLDALNYRNAAKLILVLAMHKLLFICIYFR